jgi:carnitine-CoA ligase
MAIVVLNPGELLSPADLFEYLRPRIAHFALPRYIRFRDDLPRTPSLRVQKHILRAEGIPPGCWDREAEGIVVKREQI